MKVGKDANEEEVTLVLHCQVENRHKQTYKHLSMDVNPNENRKTAFLV